METKVHGAAHVRDRIETFLDEVPGANTRRVAAEVGLEETTTDYHLRRLRKEGKVVKERVGRETLWWPARAQFCPVLRRAVPAFRRPGVPETACAMEHAPLPSTELARRGGVSVSAARWATRVLEETGLAERTDKGRVRLVEGARTCIPFAAQGRVCDRWGRCPLSEPARGAAESAMKGPSMAHAWSRGSPSSRASSSRPSTSRPASTSDGDGGPSRTAS